MIVYGHLPAIFDVLDAAGEKVGEEQRTISVQISDAGPIEDVGVPGRCLFRTRSGWTYLVAIDRQALIDGLGRLHAQAAQSLLAEQRLSLPGVRR